MARFLATIALVPPASVVYFVIFWTGFSFWRRHVVAIYTVMLGVLGGATVAAFAFADHLLAPAIAMPYAVRVAGGVVVGAATVFGTIADRQIGFRTRAFVPFFDDHGKIELVSTGAYGIVRHPIYASGIAFQLGVFLLTGAIAVAIATVAFALGAVWFTRQEERRLAALLDDPAAYDRYRARVGGLFPRLTSRRPSRP
jgi:protein-S-isoprenylcysteine O-methyltransferase Ste14